jgi:hypothetical protein
MIPILIPILILTLIPTLLPILIPTILPTMDSSQCSQWLVVVGKRNSGQATAVKEEKRNSGQPHKGVVIERFNV